MKTSLLQLTTIIECGVGLALMASPALVGQFLFGSAVAGAAIPLGRVGGFGLLSLGIAAWPSGSSASAWRGMLTYNALAALFLISLGLGREWVGPLLWPAAIYHAVITVLLARRLPAVG